MNKVYIITKGIYSDYHICAVTLSKARAEKLKKQFSDEWFDDDSNNARIEEFVLDEANPERMYGVKLSKSDGQFLSVVLDEYEWHDSGEVDNWSSDECCKVWVKARSEDSAVKAAYDIYAQYKAKREGIA